MRVVDRIKFESEAEWLEARKAYVTATEVAQLVRRGEAYWGELREMKAGIRPRKDLSHVPAVRHGKEREKAIVPFVQSLEPELVHNEDLVVRLGRYAATPDLLGDGIVGEIKTVKDTRLAKLEAAGDWPTGAYRDQVQWQLFVTGAISCVFAWEPCELWEGEFIPREDLRDHITIYRDEERIKQLRSVADRFLEGNGTPEAPKAAQGLLVELARVRAEKDRVVAPVLEEEKRILDELKQLADGRAAAWEHDGVRVTVTGERESKRLDKKRLFADHPQIAEDEYMVTSKVAPSIRVTEKDKEDKQ